MNRELLSVLWRAVARHAEPGGWLAAAVEGLGASAARLWLFDAERRDARLVGQAGKVGSRAPQPPVEAEVPALIAWARMARPSRAPGAFAPPEAVALPLSRGDSAGAVVFTGTRVRDSTAAELIEPLSVGLDNYRRIEALERVRDAYEADRQALLRRLGREDITDSIIGAETGLREALERVAQVAPTDVPVVLLGETGSGKEVVARTIHARSTRAAGPMLRVNCGAIPGELIDSELFGHEAGAFTGATYTRKGWFERAHRGTLFLDEVGELPAAAQVRLLRVLQDGLIERVGGQQSIRVDVRIIAATHRDLTDPKGGFRKDLWYRLNVFPIRLPALRERRQDVPSLATHFATRAARRLGIRPSALTAADISQLVAYDWPGNVRELQAVIDRATILGNGERLEIAAALGQPQSRAAAALPAATSAAPLDAVLKGHIVAALERSLGRIEGPFGAARALGVNPHTLRARMRKMKIDWSRYRP